jgi:hypothetical protein
MTVTNTLAYYGTEIITYVNSFMVHVPQVTVLFKNEV